ncbi:MAG: hypothetical protein U0U67_15070 [Chitinophagales bacterium]
MLTDKKLNDLKKKVYELQIHIKSCSEVLDTIIKEIEENDKPPTKGQSAALKRQANKTERMNRIREMFEMDRIRKMNKKKNNLD